MTRILPDDVTLTDSHCHLDFPTFDNDRAGVVDRALAAGVTRMVTICTKLENAPQVQSIADQFAPVFWAAGTHPMSVADTPMASVEELVALAAHPKFVGIGESGLDYHYTAQSAQQQQDSLRIHIEAARRTDLPLIIHARAADEDMARILSEEHAAGAFGCVMHCFSSSPALAQTAVDLGFYLSMSGITAFPKSHELREIFQDVPRDRILVETDSPYLAPPPYRGKDNEPAYVAHTATRAAETFEMDVAEFAALTQENFLRLFAKVAQYEAAQA